MVRKHFEMDKKQSSKMKRSGGDTDDSELYQGNNDLYIASDDDVFKEKKDKKKDYVDTVRLVYITFRSMEAKEIV